MRQTTVLFVGALCLSLASFVPITAYSEISEYPNTPMAAISEVHRDWVKITTFNVPTSDEALESLQPSVDNPWAHLELLNPDSGLIIWFDINNTEHMRQVWDQARFGCDLYEDRTPIILSYLHDADSKQYEFLFACSSR